MAKQEVTFSPEAVSTLFSLRPDLAKEVADSIDSQIDSLTDLRDSVASFTEGGKKKGRRRSSGTRVKRGMHGEMAIKILAELNATSKTKGVTSKQIKDSPLHDFGSALNATLDGLANKEIIKYENVSEGEKARYIWWLGMPEDKALATAAEAAKAGRKPKNGK